MSLDKIDSTIPNDAILPIAIMSAPQVIKLSNSEKITEDKDITIPNNATLPIATKSTSQVAKSPNNKKVKDKDIDSRANQKSLVNSTTQSLDKEKVTFGKLATSNKIKPKTEPVNNTPSKRNLISERSKLFQQSDNTPPKSDAVIPKPSLSSVSPKKEFIPKAFLSDSPSERVTKATTTTEKSSVRPPKKEMSSFERFSQKSESVAPKVSVSTALKKDIVVPKAFNVETSKSAVLIQSSKEKDTSALKKDIIVPKTFKVETSKSEVLLKSNKKDDTPTSKISAFQRKYSEPINPLPSSAPIIPPRRTLSSTPPTNFLTDAKKKLSFVQQNSSPELKSNVDTPTKKRGLVVSEYIVIVIYIASFNG